MDTEITQLLTSWRSGDEHALNELIENLMPELKKIALAHMRKESVGHTLQATAVVNEAYIRLHGSDQDWQHRAHFLAVASTVMRHVLVDYAKSKTRQKRGGDRLQITLDDGMFIFEHDHCEVLALDDALSELEAFDPRGSKILEMKCFSGMKMNDIADTLNISIATAERNLKSVRAWVINRLALK